MITKINYQKLSIGFHLRNWAYFCFRVINKILRIKPGISVLCYHSIADDDWRFCTPLIELEKQINYLIRNDYRFVSAGELADHVSGKNPIKEKSVLITFDDGYADVIKSKELFEKYKISPLIFVLADSEKINRHELDTNRQLLTQEAIMDLKKSGWDIGCHSATHADFSNLTSEELEYEIVKSKNALEKKLGFEIKYFAYPKGQYNKDALYLAEKAGYIMAFSVDDSREFSMANRFKLPRVGVDRSHSIREFASISLPVSIIMRKVLRLTPLSNLI